MCPPKISAGAEGEGFGIAMNGLNGGRLNIAACSLGGAQAASTRPSPTCAIARRSARARSIGAAISPGRHGDRLGDVAPDAVARGRALDAKAPDNELCAMAKRYVTDSCFDVADEALQLLGGYGYLASTAWRRSSAICGCTGSWRAPTKSCALIVARGLVQG